MGVTKRDLKRMFKGDHRMSLLIDMLEPQQRGEITWAIGEIPTGVIDGNNRVFQLAHEPVGGVALHLYPMTRFLPDDFTVDGTTITLAAHVVPPADDERILADYPYLKL